MIRAWSSLLLGPLVITVLLTGCSSTGVGEVTVQEEALVPMLVVGKGETPAAARADALQRATEKVVGAYIIAETSLEDDVIREEITSLSAGIVEGWDEIRMVQDEEGTYSGTYEVQVNTDPITSMLMSRSISPTVNEGSGGAVEGREMLELALRKKEAAQVKAALREQFAEDAREAITILMEGFPKDYLYASEVSPLKIIDTSASDSVLVEATYELAHDPERYEEFIESLGTLLRKVGRETKRINWVHSSPDKGRDRTPVSAWYSLQMRDASYRFEGNQVDETVHRVALISTNEDKDRRMFNGFKVSTDPREGLCWRGFTVDGGIGNAFRSFRDSMSSNVIAVELYGDMKSGDSSVLARESVGATPGPMITRRTRSGRVQMSDIKGHFVNRWGEAGTVISPMPGKKDPSSLTHWYLPKERITFTWRMSHEAMEKLTRVEARVVIE